MMGMNGSHSLEESLRQIEGMDKLSSDRYFKVTDFIRPAIQEAIEEGLNRDLPNNTLSGCLADFVAYRIVQIIKNYNFNEERCPGKIDFPDDGEF